MKKLLKMLLCMMLAAALVFSFAACGNDKKEDTASQSDEKDKKVKKDEEESPEEKAEETAKNFMDAFCAMEPEEMAKYAVDPGEIEDAFPFDDIREYIKEGAYSEMGADAEVLSAMIDPVMDKYIDLFLDTISYKILNCTEDEGGYIFETEMEMADADAAAKALEEALSEDNLSVIVEELAVELASNGTITEQSTEEETVKALLDGVAGKMLPIIEKAVTEAGTVKETLELVVVEDGEDWLVDTEKSNALEDMKIGKSFGITSESEN